MSLEQRFHAAVDAIQKLPSTGSFQPSNFTKLIFYGLYKQATVGPCNEPKPSAFNITKRAKWEAWDRYRALTKEEAMVAYINEIRNLIKTMPHSAEVEAFQRLIDPPEETQTNQSVDPRGKSASISSVMSGTSTLSARAASEHEESFEDPLDQAFADTYDIISPTTSFYQTENPAENRNSTIPTAQPPMIRTTTQSSLAPSSNFSTGDNTRETQKTILSALMKLQDDVHHILERLNRLETCPDPRSQRDMCLSSDANTSLGWFPLAGLRRRAIVFILLWPFVALGLLRLFLRAKIIIRFRQRRVL